MSAVPYLEREHRTCSNGIERRLCVSAVSRCSEVTEVGGGRLPLLFLFSKPDFANEVQSCKAAEKYRENQ